MNMKTILCLLLALLAWIPTKAVAGETKEQPDRLCQMLFDTYIARRGKINTSTVMAASHIVAERGRNTGFWRDVLGELKKEKDESEIGCVQVLGKMLETDAVARDVIRREKETGEIGQWAASVCLGPEVVTELISRGQKADRFRTDHYAIALARARVSVTSDFSQMILRDDTGKRYMDGTKFHAALGLAQVGDSAGFEWLIAHCTDTLPTVSNAWPDRVANLNLDTCCHAALRQLSGKKDVKTKQEWEAWWTQIDKKALPQGRVNLVLVTGIGSAEETRVVPVSAQAQAELAEFRVGKPLLMSVTISNGLSKPIRFTTFSTTPTEWNGETLNTGLVDVYRNNQKGNLYRARPQVKVPDTISGPASKPIQPGAQFQVLVDISKWTIDGGWSKGEYELVFRMDNVIVDERITMSVLSDPVHVVIQ